MSQVTVRAVLFGDAEPADVVAGTPGWRALVNGLGPALSAVSAGGRRVVERETASALGGLLALDLGDVLVAGWRHHRALLDAARATRADAAATEVVQLATHRVTTAHRPYVEVVVNGVTIATVGFEVSLALDVDAVLATVRGGRLVAVHGGQCTVTVALSAGGRELASRQARLDPAVTVWLGEGVDLLDEDAAGPAAKASGGAGIARGRASVPQPG